MRFKNLVSLLEDTTDDDSDIDFSSIIGGVEDDAIENGLIDLRQTSKEDILNYINRIGFVEFVKKMFTPSSNVFWVHGANRYTIPGWVYHYVRDIILQHPYIYFTKFLNLNKPHRSAERWQQVPRINLNELFTSDELRSIVQSFTPQQQLELYINFGDTPYIKTSVPPKILVKALNTVVEKAPGDNLVEKLSHLLKLKDKASVSRRLDLIVAYGELTTLKIGKAAPIKNEYAIKLPFNEKTVMILSSPTRGNLEKFQTEHNVTYENIYVAERSGRGALTYCITGKTRSGKPFIYGRIETGSTQAGQTKIFTQQGVTLFSHLTRDTLIERVK